MSDLYILSIINEQIKQIVRISDTVYLVALNAMFQARKAKGRAAGFATITTEFRRFSRDMDLAMTRLKKLVDKLIMVLAGYLKRKKIFDLLSSANCKRVSNGKNQPCAEQSMNMIRRELQDAGAQFGAELAKIRRLCEVGESLSVLAKVEANAAGEFTDALMPVVTQVGQSVEKLMTGVNQANSRFFELSFNSSSDALARAS